jgi:hypothetical protein
MNIDILIKKLIEYRHNHGNVVLYSQKDDGQSSWNSPMTLSIQVQNPWPKLDKPQHFIAVDAGY